MRVIWTFNEYCYRFLHHYYFHFSQFEPLTGLRDASMTINSGRFSQNVRTIRDYAGALRKFHKISRCVVMDRVGRLWSRFTFPTTPTGPAASTLVISRAHLGSRVTRWPVGYDECARVVRECIVRLGGYHCVIREPPFRAGRGKYLRGEIESPRSSRRAAPFPTCVRREDSIFRVGLSASGSCLYLWRLRCIPLS